MRSALPNRSFPPVRGPRAPNDSVVGRDGLRGGGLPLRPRPNHHAARCPRGARTAKQTYRRARANKFPERPDSFWYPRRYASAAANSGDGRRTSGDVPGRLNNHDSNTPRPTACSTANKHHPNHDSNTPCTHPPGPRERGIYPVFTPKLSHSIKRHNVSAL